ncbi:MAG TPA: hypothetical protein VLA48_03275 [Nitrososphaeraceae archaeon]|nr:hypothetical protein [Nitrososphaeraceae archaeon]
MIVELIIGGLILAGIVIFAIKNKKSKNEIPDAKATELPLPPKPKKDKPS